MSITMREKMDSVIKNYLLNIELGKPQKYKNM
ncbi:unnamed protein product, partial [marine sediment metagenome]